MMYLVAHTFEMPQSWLKKIVEVCEKELEINADGEYIADKKYFILRHITNYTFTFGVGGFYLGQLLLSYKGKTVPPSDNVLCSCCGLRLVLAFIVGAVCAIRLLLTSTMAKKGNLWMALICYGILPILLIYPLMMYLSTTLLICATGSKKEDHSIELANKKTDLEQK